MHSSRVPKQVKQRGLWIKATLSDSCSNMKFFLLIISIYKINIGRTIKQFIPVTLSKTSSYGCFKGVMWPPLSGVEDLHVHLPQKVCMEDEKKSCLEVKVHDVQIGFSFFDGRLEGWPGHECWLIVFILLVTNKMASSIDNSTCLAI